MNSGTSANTYAHVDTLYTHISGRGKEKLGEGQGGGRERERNSLSYRMIIDLPLGIFVGLVFQVTSQNLR